MKFVINPSSNAQFYFTIIARNGRILCTSETYTEKVSCLKSIKAIKTEFFDKDIPIVDKTIKTLKHGKVKTSGV